MRKRILLIAISMLTTYGCTYVKKESLSVTYERKSYNENLNAITFTSSSNGLFSYKCAKFEPNTITPDNLFSPGVTTQGNIPTIGQANLFDSLGNPINLKDADSLKLLANNTTIYANWERKRYTRTDAEFSYDNLQVQKLIERCKADYKADQERFLNEMRKAQEQAEQYKKHIRISIDKVLARHHKQATANGGAVSLNEVLLNQRYQDKTGYRAFLDGKNRAYLIDFSGYTVSQVISQHRYVLRNVIENYYVPSMIPPLPIVLTTQKQLFEGDTPTQGIAIYNGIELLETMSGTRKQFVSLTYLD